MTLLAFCYTGESQAAITLGPGDQNPVEMFALVLGGIGIFLTGISFVGFNLNKMTSGSFRNLIQNISNNKLGILSWGILLGLVTQSGKATAFILSDFVKAGTIKARQCAPILFWGNGGSSLIVFASMLAIKILALMTLGVTALGMTFNFPKKLVNVYGVIFGLTMIMYGLYLVKLGSAGFASFGLEMQWLELINRFSLLSFAIGFTLTLLVQSNLAIMMIAIALATANILTLEQAAMWFYGAQAATGLLTYIFSFHTSGRARQVVAYQISFDVVASTTFVALFYLETLTGIPLYLWLCRSISDHAGSQALALALLFQFSSVIILLKIKGAIFQYVEGNIPASSLEVLSEPKFLHKKVAESPETGILLIEKEQFRLLQRLPHYIDNIRDPSATVKTSPQIYNQAFIDICKSIEQALSDISGFSLSKADSSQLLRMTKSQEQLVNLERTVYKLTRTLEKQDLKTRAGSLGKNIMESLDFIILTTIDAIESKDMGEIDDLSRLTYDRTDMMEKFRQDYFNSEQELTRQERTFILDITILFESAVQTLSRYGLLIAPELEQVQAEN